MRPHKSEAIVLHTFPVKERDKLVVFLTPEQGKVRGWAYGARSLRSRFGASLEPLAKVVLTWVEKENEETVRLETASMVRSLFPAQQNLRSSIAATYLAETVDTFAQSNEPSELVYRLLDRCCEALLGELNPVAVVAYFEVWILKLAGIFPSLQHCRDCHATLEGPLRFDPDRAGFVCGNCGGRSEVVPNARREILLRLLTLPVGEFAALTLPQSEIFEIRLLARDLRRHFLGHELKSYEVLQALV
jgi:DNA repair protein RecO (recombination protein O)